MPLAQYWNGTAWETLVGAGGTPSSQHRPVRPQPGSVLAGGTVALGHDIPGAPGNQYIVSPGWINPGYFFQCNHRCIINVALYVGGTGSADVATFGQIVNSAGQQVGASGTTTHTHAFYWVGSMLTAEIYAAAGGANVTFRVMLHFVGGVDVHVVGGANYVVVAE